MPLVSKSAVVSPAPVVTPTKSQAAKVVATQPKMQKLRTEVEKHLPPAKGKRASKPPEGAPLTKPATPAPTPVATPAPTGLPKGPRTLKASLTPSQLKEEIKGLLKELEATKDPEEKKRLRRMLRARGHRGGLTCDVNGTPIAKIAPPAKQAANNATPTTSTGGATQMGVA